MKHDQPNAVQLRTIVKAWLSQNALRPAWLAQQSGVNPSVVSRFLNGVTQLDEISALRVYKCIKWRMSDAEQQDYLSAAGLLSLLQDAIEPIRINPSQAGQHVYFPFLKGMDYLRLAETSPQMKWTEAIELFAAAERAFGLGSSNGAYAACQGARRLSMLGRLDEADTELVRVGTTYEGIMDITTQAEYATARGYVSYDRGNLVDAHFWFSKVIDLAQAAGIPDLADESLNYMVMIPLDIIASPVPISKQVRATRLSEAEKWLQKFRQRILSEPILLATSWVWYHLYRAQLRHAQRRTDEATADLAIARRLMPDYGTGPGHCDIRAAEIMLDHGNTAIATRLMMPTLDAYESYSYASGIARVMRILAMAELMDGRAAQAFEFSLAALCVHPFGTYQDRTKLDSVFHAARASLQAELAPMGYRALIQTLRDKAVTRQSAFSPLTTILLPPNTSLDDAFKRAVD